MLTLRCTMCAIYTAYIVWWEVIDVVQVVAAQAVGRGLWQEGYQHQTFKDKNKRLYDFSIEISPGNSRRKSETWLGSRMSIGVGGCDDNSTGRLLGR